MKSIAIDTHSNICRVAIYNEIETLAYTYLQIKIPHSQNLLYIIHSLLNITNLNLDNINFLSIVSGPGSFTGLRIGMSIAKTIAIEKKIPLIEISSLEVYSHTVEKEGYICPIIDARREEIYTALYVRKKEKIKQIEPSIPISPQKWIIKLKKYKDKKIYLIGKDLEKYKEVFKKLQNIELCDKKSEFLFINAVRYLAYEKYQNKIYRNILDIEPLYLRKSDAEINLKKE